MLHLNYQDKPYRKLILIQWTGYADGGWVLYAKFRAKDSFPAIRDPFGSIALAFMHRFPGVKQYPYSWIVWMLYWSVSLFLPESCQLLEEKIVDQEKWFSSLSAGGSQKNVLTNLFLPWYFLNLGRLTVPSWRSIWFCKFYGAVCVIQYLLLSDEEVIVHYKAYQYFRQFCSCVLGNFPYFSEYIALNIWNKKIQTYQKYLTDEYTKTLDILLFLNIDKLSDISSCVYPIPMIQKLQCTLACYMRCTTPTGGIILFLPPAIIGCIIRFKEFFPFNWEQYLYTFNRLNTL